MTHRETDPASPLRAQRHAGPVHPPRAPPGGEVP